MDLLSKDGTSVAVVTERTKPTLVMIGNRQVSSSGRWNDSLMADYILTNGRLKWLSVGDLAKVAYGQNVPRSKKMVRRRLSSVFTELLVRGELLVIEYGPPNNRARNVKLFHRESEIDRQAAKQRLERMRRRRELTTEQYERAILVIQEQDCAPVQSALDITSQ